MNKSPQLNNDSDTPSFLSLRHTVSNPVLVEAINEHKINTGKSNEQLMRDCLISYLEDREEITVG